MAKTKIADEPEEEPKDKELLTPVRAVVGFTDGNLSESLGKYGYPPEWTQGQVRKLPLWLINRCKNSGAELEFMAG